MTATNHALTGAVIGLSISNPILAIPLSLASHYVLDTFPHFGNKWNIKSSQFARYLVAEALVCLLIVIIIFSTKPTHWLLGAICAFVAASPDLLSINHFVKGITNKTHKPSSYFKWAKRIQKKEAPENIKYEIAWALIFVSLLAGLIVR